MKMGLEDKVIIITGAAGGIGGAIARMAATEGVGAVMLTDLNGRGSDALAAELAGETDVATVVADLADTAATGAIVRATMARFGRIDGLVNAGGITTRGSFVTGTPAIWDQLFAVNARAGFLLMQAAIADMRARGAAGSIVNILSMNAHCGLPELAMYAATKGAMQTLTRNAGNAHMADRIRVNGINLGWVASDAEDHMQAVVLGKGADWQKAAGARLPLGRLITAEECARLAVFLLGDASLPMSGAIIDLEQKVAGAL